MHDLCECGEKSKCVLLLNLSANDCIDHKKPTAPSLIYTIQIMQKMIQRVITYNVVVEDIGHFIVAPYSFS